MLAPTARAQRVAEGLYYEFKRHQGFSDQEIAAKTRSLRGVLQPLSAAENHAMLDQAGFTEIFPAFRWMIFEGVIAYA